MPYEIVKSGEKYCVQKKDGGKKMGCHESRADAVDQIQAIYASEAMAVIAESFMLDITEEVEAEALIAAFTLTERNWAGPIAFENVSTGDNRQFNSEAITFDKLPIPLLFQRTSGEGHSGSVVIGRVDEIERKENDVIFAKGVILEGIPEADEFLALMEHGAAGGVSVDGDSAQYQVEEVEEGGQKKVQFTSMRIRGLTAVAIPAFADAQIELTDEEEVQASDETEELSLEDIEANEELLEETLEELAKKRRRKRKTQRAYSWKLAEEQGITAAAAPVKPPLEWFANPLVDQPTPLTITPDGRVFGHIALFGTCHIGMPKCTKPPKGGTYNYFHTGELETEDGTPVAVGHLTFNTGHASVYDNAFNAASHYDNTGTVGADVVAGEDKFGVWVAGALRPHLSDEEVRAFRAAPISGDWRRIQNKMELVAALSVNTPGFPVPRAKALVASGALTPEAVITMQDEDEISDLNERTEFRSFLANKVKDIFQMEYTPREVKAALITRVALATEKLASNQTGGTFEETETIELTAETEEFNLEAVMSAIEHLQLAADLHMSHINGTEPTSEASQEELMMHINSALSALQDGMVKAEHEMEDEEYEEYSAFLDELSEEELVELEGFLSQDILVDIDVEEFYNQCHDPDTGFFCEGPDGPGRVRDNMKKAEAIVGKKAPTYIKNLISRRLNKAQGEASKTLGKKAPQYMKDLLSKRVTEAVTKNKKVEDLPIGEYKRSSRGRRPKG